MTAYLGSNTDFSPVPAAELRRWVEQLRRLLERPPGGSPAWRATIDEAIESLGRTGVVVAFVGNQKAGKSTLLNGALGRPILAVDDLPETGTVCRLVAGAADQGWVVQDERSVRRFRVRCDAESIRQITALQPGAERRRDDEIPERVELTLKGVPIPPGVTWLDTPGVDDTAEMTARSRRAAAGADVLIFVSSSRQFLSDGETDYLRHHVARSGPASVILVINAFLRQLGPADWDRFVAKVLGAHRNRVADRSHDMGFRDCAPLLAYPVCARALAEGDGALLGGRQFMEVLLGLRSPDHPRVVRTRLFKLSRRLGKLAAFAADRAATMNSQLIAREEQEKARAQQAEQNLARFRRRAGEVVGELIGDATERLRKAGAEVRESVTTDFSKVSVLATCEYDGTLKQKATAAVSEAVSGFMQRLRDAASAHDQRRPGDDLNGKVRALLYGHKFNVIGGSDVAGVGKGSALGGALAAAGASWWLHVATGGLSLAVAAGAGAAVGAAARDNAQKKAAGEARDRIRTSIDGETGKAQAIVAGAKAAILQLAIDACAREVPPAGPVDRSEARELAAFGAELRALAIGGLRLAGWGG